MNTPNKDKQDRPNPQTVADAVTGYHRAIAGGVAALLSLVLVLVVLWMSDPSTLLRFVASLPVVLAACAGAVHTRDAVRTLRALRELQREESTRL